MRSGLRFFGLTVAQSALDQSGDGLPDIAVGSKGAVLLLRLIMLPHPYTTSSVAQVLILKAHCMHTLHTHMHYIHTYRGMLKKKHKKNQS